jgi:hypothetical protein
VASAPLSSGPPLYVPEGVPEAETPAEDDRPVRVIAGTRRRVAARVIDLLITAYLVPGGLLSLFFVVLLSSGAPEDLEWVAGIFVAPVLAIFFLLRVARLAWFGCTVGQRVAGIRVVRLEDGTRHPSWRQALKRWTVPRSQAVLPPVGDIQAHEQDRPLGRCLHDRNAGTVVVLARATTRERVHRIVLGSLLAVLMAATPLAPLAAAYLALDPVLSKLPTEGGGAAAFKVDALAATQRRLATPMPPLATLLEAADASDAGFAAPRVRERIEAGRQGGPPPDQRLPASWTIDLRNSQPSGRRSQRSAVSGPGGPRLA